MHPHSPPPGLQVREAASADVRAIALLRSLWWSDGTIDPGYERRLAAFLEQEGERRTTWLAELAGAPAGMVSLFEYRRMPRPGSPNTCWGYLGNMFVRAELRNRGIGSSLVHTVTAEADRRGYVRLSLSPSERAAALFGRHGFLHPGADSGERLLVRPGPRSNAP